MHRPPRVAEVVLLFAFLSSAACGGDSGGGQADATVVGADAAATDAMPTADAASLDAAATGHPAAELVPAGAASRSESYRFVGTLSSGSQAASPGHSVRTGVVGVTQ